jgi:endonuclease/exonuclease/phosphatase family metal-dependent hydrolase
MLRIITLNCNYYVDKHGHWEKRKYLINDLIRDTSPDVVLLQAVCQDPLRYLGIDQASQIAERIGYRHVQFQAADVDPYGCRRGQAIISRHQFITSAGLRLSLRPGSDDITNRLVQPVSISTNHGLLHIFNVHFSWIEKQARDNIAETLSFIKRFKGMTLITGDFNNEAESAVLEPLRGNGWTDLWSVMRPCESGCTFESDKPRIRIDHAWANASLLRYFADISVHHRETPAPAVRLSDHRALSVTLSLEVDSSNSRAETITAAGSTSATND